MIVSEILFYCDRVCVVCLAPSHALLTNPDLEIVSIDFHIGNVDRQDNKVSGKRKNKFYSSALAMAIRKVWLILQSILFCVYRVPRN